MAHITRPSTFSRVLLPQQLGDGPAHRVADDDGRLDAEHVEQRGDVVGAVGQPEPAPRAQARGRGPGGRAPAPGSARPSGSNTWNQLSPPTASRPWSSTHGGCARRARRPRARTWCPGRGARPAGRGGSGRAGRSARRTVRHVGHSGHNMTIRQIVRGYPHARSSDAPDIDFVSGEFWGRDPHDELAWMRANAPVYWDGHGVGHRPLRRPPRRVEGPDDVLERRRHPARLRPASR